MNSFNDIRYILLFLYLPMLILRFRLNVLYVYNNQ